ncbi:hypothetical protein SAMN04487897_102274 [Paenibacillus sp. yr247]|uniref:hypothetical protein n=1 Tax=Paenibacillus sp. yr247 TaxID=1761880 RepID=UPI000891A9B9|nr:hypothetical protein [Paenibacillus sp. yr247]SDN24869.1 hypothetical protein SAMN04487897_102274 [Paenibacillus sp. yr247]
MKDEQKLINDPKEDNSPQKKSNESGRWSDVLGFGKMIDKLPLYKLSARMAYCMFFDLLLLIFVLVLRASGTQMNDFPNAWDLRFIVITTIVVFFVGLCDVMKGRNK